MRASLSRAASSTLPKSDLYEPNDEAGTDARPFGRPRTIVASLDPWDDPLDVYALRLVKGRHLYARLTPATAGTGTLQLWRPGTRRVAGPATLAMKLLPTVPMPKPRWPVALRKPG